MPFQEGFPALWHPRPPILPAVRDQQHISALSLLTSSEGSMSRTSLSPSLAQFPAPSGEIELKAVLCVLLQHFSESPEKTIFPVNSKKICRSTCSLLTQDWQRETWLILQLCSPPWESCSPRTHEFLACGAVIPVHRGDAMLQLTQSVGCIRTEPEASAICVSAWAIAELSSVCNEILSASSVHKSE